MIRDKQKEIMKNVKYKYMKNVLILFFISCFFSANAQNSEITHIEFKKKVDVEITTHGQSLKQKVVWVKISKSDLIGEVLRIRSVGQGYDNIFISYSSSTLLEKQKDGTFTFTFDAKTSDERIIKTSDSGLASMIREAYK